MSKKEQSGLSLSAKAKKFGVSLSTLKTVYKRGVAAWNSGHRPGTTPQQWGHARVNSYLRKGKTYHTADKDLHEEIEQLDELKKETLQSYLEKRRAPKFSDIARAETVGKPEERQKDIERANLTRISRARAKRKLQQIDRAENPQELVQQHHDIHHPYASRVPGVPDKPGSVYWGDHVEHEDVNKLFEMQLVGTDEYTQYALAMTPGQDQEIEDAFPPEVYGTMVDEPAEEEPTVAESDGPAEFADSKTSGNSFRSIRKRLQEQKDEEAAAAELLAQLAAQQGEEEGEEDAEEEEEEVGENDGAEDGVDFTPTLKTKKAKGYVPQEFAHADSSGLPVLSTSLYEETILNEAAQQIEEAIDYHINNKISLVENIFRPGSDMFFAMILEAKRRYDEGSYIPKDDFELDLLESDIGEVAEYDGVPVLLDFPYEEIEEINEGDVIKMDQKPRKWQPQPFDVEPPKNVTNINTRVSTTPVRNVAQQRASQPVQPGTMQVRMASGRMATVNPNELRVGVIPPPAPAPAGGSRAPSSGGYNSSTRGRVGVSLDGYDREAVRKSVEAQQKFFRDFPAAIENVTGKSYDEVQKAVQRETERNARYAARVAAKKTGAKTASRLSRIPRVGGLLAAGALAAGAAYDQRDKLKSFFGMDSKPTDKQTVKEEKDPTRGKGIGKPFRSRGGGAVYVRNAKGNVVRVNFSQSGMKKRYNEPARVRSFMARHNCLGNKDRTSASYWACRWPRYFSDSGQQWW